MKQVSVDHFIDASKTQAHGVCMVYDSNSLKSFYYRTLEENFEYAKYALCLLLDIEPDILFGKNEHGTTMFEDAGGQVVTYRQMG